MQDGRVELPVVPSPFWAMLALLRREPGMRWLPLAPGGCAGPGEPSGVEAGRREGAGECDPGVLAGCVMWVGGGVLVRDAGRFF